PVHQLDDRDLGSQRVVYVSELEADRRTADRKEAFGNLTDLQGTGAVHDRLVVDVESGDGDGPGAGGDDESLRLVLLVAHLYRTRPGELRLTFDQVDLVSLEELTDAAREL